MRWRERIPRWMSEFHGEVAYMVGFVLANDLYWAWDERELRAGVMIWIALGVAAVLILQAMLTTVAWTLWKSTWREAIRKMTGAFGRGVLLMVIMVALMMVMMTLECGLDPLFGLESYWLY